MSMITAIDHQILLWVQGIRTEALNPIIKSIGYLGTAGAVWIILLLILLMNRRTRRAAIVAAITFALAMAICYAIKFSVGRVRPYETYKDIICLVRKQWDHSFPSGHACSSFAVSIALLRQTKTWYQKTGGVLVLILAMAISLSRIYVCVHYPTDVLVGALLGCVTALIVTAISNKMNGNGGHKAPKRRENNG